MLMNSTTRLALLLLTSCLFFACPALMAQAALTDSDDTLQELIVTGTRQSGIAAAESAAPIQILSKQALDSLASSPDLLSALSQVVPSLNLEAYGFDQEAQTLMVRLYGLSPNHVLILVNGKRRHTTANLAVDNGDVYQGGANVDMNFIPVDAIDHIEVLTQGAAAQYGTDAIAGVINIILKKDPTGGSLSATYGHYYQNGGNNEDVSGNLGMQPFSGAFLNITGEVHDHGRSNETALDERVVNPANLASYPNSNLPQIPGYPYLNKSVGDAEQHLEIMSFNSGVTLEDSTQFYLFGTYGAKHMASYENYRLPSKVCYPEYPFTSANIADGNAGDCEPNANYPFPNGFNPQDAIQEVDYQVTGGFKGTAFGWNWDISSGYGRDHINVYTLDSANAGLFGITGTPTTLTNFYDGLLVTSQWATTLDVSRDFNVGLPSPLNLAWGSEYRRESYQIGAGVPSSWQDGGAQSYPGFAPTDAGTHFRENIAAYLDLATKPVDALRIDVAGRFEHYSDFGNATVGKFTTRYDFTPEFAVRGTVQNGFRAPTLAEEYYSSTDVTPTSAFVQLPPNSAGGKLLGLGNGLQPEKSLNYSVGLVFRPQEAMTVTLDLYQIAITNRIVGSGSLVGSWYSWKP